MIYTKSNMQKLGFKRWNNYFPGCKIYIDIISLYFSQSFYFLRLNIFEFVYTIHFNVFIILCYYNLPNITWNGEIWSYINNFKAYQLYYKCTYVFQVENNIETEQRNQRKNWTEHGTKPETNKIIIQLLFSNKIRDIKTGFWLRLMYVYFHVENVPFIQEARAHIEVPLYSNVPKHNDIVDLILPNAISLFLECCKSKHIVFYIFEYFLTLFILFIC